MPTRAPKISRVNVLSAAASGGRPQRLDRIVHWESPFEPQVPRWAWFQRFSIFEMFVIAHKFDSKLTANLSYHHQAFKVLPTVMNKSSLTWLQCWYKFVKSCVSSLGIINSLNMAVVLFNKLYSPCQQLLEESENLGKQVSCSTDKLNPSLLLTIIPITFTSVLKVHFILYLVNICYSVGL